MTEPRKRNTSGLKPFKKGFDERRNLKGKPKSFDQLRDFLQSVLQEEIKDGADVKTRIRQIAEAMASDKRLMKDLLEFAYGKVPLSQIVDITSGGKPLNWREFINGSGDTKELIDGDDGNTDTKTSSDKS